MGRGLGWCTWCYHYCAWSWTAAADIAIKSRRRPAGPGANLLSGPGEHIGVPAAHDHTAPAPGHHATAPGHHATATLDKAALTLHSVADLLHTLRGQTADHLGSRNGGPCRQQLREHFDGQVRRAKKAHP